MSDYAFLKCIAALCAILTLAYFLACLILLIAT